MANRNAIELGYYPIKITDVKKYIKNCEQWGYTIKATCKYVAESVIDKLDCEYPELPITDTLYDELVSIAYDINNGKIRLRIKIKYKTN